MTSPQQPLLDDWSPGACAALRRRLLPWFARHGRPLPWRQTSDPYCIWISEIMLQQTTVAAVEPYYHRFLRRFPNVGALAAASEAEVLACWEGLGYYRRGRNLHAAAREIVQDYGGRPPNTVEDWQALPGVGRYTAGAIVSFAFNRPAPILEANTLRLYCRLLGFPGDPTSAVGQKLLWSFAERLLPKTQPGQVNQALMELGAVVCRPRDPDCLRCPLRTICRARRDGRQADIPRPKARPAVTTRTEVLVAVQHRGRVLLRRCGDDEPWSGLWDFVRLRAPISSPAAPPTVQGGARARGAPSVGSRAVAELQRSLGLHLAAAVEFPSTTYAITRYRVHLQRLSAECVSAPGAPPAGYCWTPWRALPQHPLPASAREFAEELVRSKGPARSPRGRSRRRSADTMTD